MSAMKTRDGMMYGQTRAPLAPLPIDSPASIHTAELIVRIKNARIRMPFPWISRSDPRSMGLGSSLGIVHLRECRNSRFGNQHIPVESWRRSNGRPGCRGVVAFHRSGLPQVGPSDKCTFDNLDRGSLYPSARQESHFLPRLARIRGCICIRNPGRCTTRECSVQTHFSSFLEL